MYRPSQSQPLVPTGTACRAPRVWHVGGWVGTKETKSHYWLGTAKLRRLDVRSVGGGLGMGCPENFYNPQDLDRMAILTHGGRRRQLHVHVYGEEGQARQAYRCCRRTALACTAALRRRHRRCRAAPLSPRAVFR